MMTSDKELLSEKFLIYCIIAAEFLRFTLPFIYNPIHHLWSDPGRWWEYAQTGIETPPLALIDAPFYQAWMSFIAKFTLDIPELTALYAGTLSLIMPWFWYRFFRELLDSKRQALVGWLLIASLPSWMGIYSYFMSETLLLALLGLSLWLGFRSLRKQTTESFFIAVVFCVLCALTRGITAPMLFVFLGLIWFHQHNKLKTAFWVLLFASLIFASLSFRSYTKSGLISPLGQPMLNTAYAHSGKKEIKIIYYSDSDYGFAYGFSSPSIDSMPLSPISQWTPQRDGVFHVDIDINNQAESWENAILGAKLTRELSYTDLMLENLILLFFGSSWPDNNSEHFIEGVAKSMRFIWFPLFVLAIILMIKNLKHLKLDIRTKFWKNNVGLKHVGLQNADLNNADLNNADLNNADLNNADLNNAGLTKVVRLSNEYKSLILLSVCLCWFVFQGLVLLSVNEGRYRKPIEGIVIAMILLSINNKKTNNQKKSSIYVR